MKIHTAEICIAFRYDIVYVTVTFLEEGDDRLWVSVQRCNVCQRGAVFGPFHHRCLELV